MSEISEPHQLEMNGHKLYHVHSHQWEHNKKKESKMQLYVLTALMDFSMLMMKHIRNEKSMGIMHVYGKMTYRVQSTNRNI
jgi:hypothetical protein